MDEVWERARNGQHTALLGLSPGDPPASFGVHAVRVRCDVPPSTLGPLHEARHKVESVLGSHPPLLDQARDRMVLGLRRRLLGEEPARDAEGALVEAWNRLAASPERPAALLFEALDAADDATLLTLRRIVARPGWLRLPLVLAFRSAAPTGAAKGLLDALRLQAGAAGVLPRRAPPRRRRCRGGARRPRRTRRRSPPRRGQASVLSPTRWCGCCAPAPSWARASRATSSPRCWTSTCSRCSISCSAPPTRACPSRIAARGASTCRARCSTRSARRCCPR